MQLRRRVGIQGEAVIQDFFFFLPFFLDITKAPRIPYEFMTLRMQCTNVHHACVYSRGIQKCFSIYYQVVSIAIYRIKFIIHTRKTFVQIGQSAERSHRKVEEMKTLTYELK